METTIKLKKVGKTVFAPISLEMFYFDPCGLNVFKISNCFDILAIYTIRETISSKYD
jgi:hypothetical protein